MNERERRDYLVRRFIDPGSAHESELTVEDAALIDGLAAASADFLDAIDSVVIPLEALASVDGTRRAYDRAALAFPESAVLLSSFGRAGDLEIATGELTAELVHCVEGVPHAARALDFGCGLGRFTGFLRDRSDWVISIDLSFELLRQVSSGARVQASSLDVIEPSCRFGLIIAVDVLPALAHLAGGRREHFVTGLFDRLAPNGALIIVNYDYEMAPESSARLISTVCPAAEVECRIIDQTLWAGSLFVVRAP